MVPKCWLYLQSVFSITLICKHWSGISFLLMEERGRNTWYYSTKCEQLYVRWVRLWVSNLVGVCLECSHSVGGTPWSMHLARIACIPTPTETISTFQLILRNSSHSNYMQPSLCMYPTHTVLSIYSLKNCTYDCCCLCWPIASLSHCLSLFPQSQHILVHTQAYWRKEVSYLTKVRTLLLLKIARIHTCINHFCSSLARSSPCTQLRLPAIVQQCR